VVLFIVTFWGATLLLTENVSTGAGIDASAPCYSRAEYIRVLPIVVAELELGNIKPVGWVERSENPSSCCGNHRKVMGFAAL
jgi:hypothetical protein